MPRAASSRVPLSLLGAFLVIWSVLAIAPLSREDWLLENLLTFALVPTLVGTYRRAPLSIAAYVATFILMVLHTIGSHYTYSLVPYGDWWQAITGTSLDMERNHYDRFVHFMYGVLIVIPSIDLLQRVSPPRGMWRFLMPLLFVMAQSTIYELIEWGAAMIVAPELGNAYLGTQGDVWDAQKDMALATAGALLTLVVWPAKWRKLLVTDSSPARQVTPLA